MVVSLNRGTPIQTRIHYNPHDWDRKKVHLILGNPHINLKSEVHDILRPPVEAEDCRGPSPEVAGEDDAGRP